MSKGPLNPRTRLSQFPVSAMALTIAAACSVPVVAQDDGFALEEVLVTATRRSESIQDVPVSVTSLGKELKEASLRRLDDIQSFTPNVYLRSHPSSPGGLTVAIRGISSDEYDKSFDPSIGVIMDGMVLGTASGSMLQNFDTKQIEVLRGPQGTLFGKNTTGGVINVIRGDVTQEWGLDASVTLGEDGRQDIKFVGNIPLIEDTLGVKVMASSNEMDGHFRNATLDKDVGAEDLQSLGFAALWTPSEEFSLKFHYENFQDDSDVGTYWNGNGPWVAQGALACIFEGALWQVGCQDSDQLVDKDTTSQARQGKSDSESDLYILTANWDLGDYLVTSITGYNDRDEQYFNNFDPSPADFLYLEYFNLWEQTSQELRLTSQFDGDFQFIAGLYYWDVEYEQFWDVGRLHYSLDALLGIAGGAWAGNPDTLLTNGQQQETTSVAAFFSGDWQINDQWTITAGIRWTEEEKDFSGGDGSLPYDPNTESRPDIAVLYKNFDDKWSETSPKIGFRYQPNDDIMVFGSYTEGFKSGGFFGRQANFTDVDVKYEPEYVESWELGLKSEWLDGRLIVNPTIFLNAYDDKQETLLVGIDVTNVATIVKNASTMDIFGAELEILFQVTPEWNLRASYGYIDAEYNDFVADINGDTFETNNDHLTPRNTPENSYGITSTYSVPVGNGELTAMASYRYRDDVYTLLDNKPRSLRDGLSNLDATISYTFGEDGRYRVSAFGRNITDEREAGYAEIAQLVGWFTWNAPATYGVEFAVSL